VNPLNPPNPEENLTNNGRRGVPPVLSDKKIRIAEMAILRCFSRC
jgi:hypothetical protein